MGIVFSIIKGILILCLILIAAAVGCCLGAFFGLFMGPVKVIEWTSNGNENYSVDKI